VGNTSGARALRIGAALMLLAWGSVDQLRYYLALRSDNLQDLQRAARLDSVDSRLQMRLAQRELAAGQTGPAEAAWKKAIESSPADPAPRQALLQFLIDRSRFDEAYELTEASLKYSPKDANLLVDRGLLALRKGHASEAIASWEQALVVDPAHALAHFYLAGELDHEGRPKLAAAHYDAFLQQIARQPRGKRPAPDKVIAIVIRMADCQARAAEKSEAIQSYRLAEGLAAQTQQQKLESVADVNEAALQAQQGDVADSLRLYQDALRLDEKTADREGGAQDWLAYGHFLDEQGFPPRFAYACFVKAQELAGSSSPEVSQAAAMAEKMLQDKKPGDLASLRRDPQPVLHAALELRP